MDYSFHPAAEAELNDFPTVFFTLRRQTAF